MITLNVTKGLERYAILVTLIDSHSVLIKNMNKKNDEKLVTGLTDLARLMNTGFILYVVFFFNVRNEGFLYYLITREPFSHQPKQVVCH